MVALSVVHVDEDSALPFSRNPLQGHMVHGARHVGSKVQQGHDMVQACYA